jgi:hypothetical protein
MNGPPIPALFHLASSGGTTTSRLLVAHYRILILNEVHPFNLFVDFNPAYPLGLANQQLNLTERDLIRSWDSQMQLVSKAARKEEKALLFRVHSHSDYFRDDLPHSRLALKRWVGPGIITVRNPLTNYFSAVQRGFVQVGLGDWLDRCEKFVHDYDHLPLFRFEDLMEKTEEMLPKMAAILGLRSREAPLSPAELPDMSGDNRNKIPISGLDFVSQNQRAIERILSNDSYAAEIKAGLGQLRALQSTLGYEMTNL